MKINHIEKVTKFISAEGEKLRLAIFIEYNEKKKKKRCLGTF